MKDPSQIPISANPAAELKRVTKRISELQARRFELLAQIELTKTEESVIVACLEVAGAVHSFLDRPAESTAAYRRKAVALSRRLNKASDRLANLQASDAKEVAGTAITESVQRLLNEAWQVKAAQSPTG